MLNLQDGHVSLWPFSCVALLFLFLLFVFAVDTYTPWTKSDGRRARTKSDVD